MAVCGETFPGFFDNYPVRPNRFVTFDLQTNFGDAGGMAPTCDHIISVAGLQEGATSDDLRGYLAFV